MLAVQTYPEQPPAIGAHGYEGYLVLVKPGDAAPYAEASGDPPTVRLP